jgi:uncharacterized protein YdeI (YjbR/CyaY-like superfamily)
VYFPDPAPLRAWLAANHATATELWVELPHAASGRAGLRWEQLVDEALCWGWIDGQSKNNGPGSRAMRISPRRRGSIWSTKNIANVGRLRAEGRMQPPGEAAFAGRTAEKSSVYSFERAEAAALEPGEEARFQRDSAAWSYFHARAGSYRKAALHWVVSAKQAATRERRLAALIAWSAKGELVPQFRPRRGPSVG